MRAVTDKRILLWMQILAVFRVTVCVMMVPSSVAGIGGSNVLMEVASTADLARLSPFVSVCLLVLRAALPYAVTRELRVDRCMKRARNSRQRHKGAQHESEPSLPRCLAHPFLASQVRWQAR